MPKFLRFVFFDDIVSDGLLQADGSHFKGLAGTGQAKTTASGHPGVIEPAISIRPKTNTLAPAPTMPNTLFIDGHCSGMDKLRQRKWNLREGE